MDFSMDFLYWENSENGYLRHVTESNWNLSGFFNGFFNLLNGHPGFWESEDLLDMNFSLVNFEKCLVPK